MTDLEELRAARNNKNVSLINYLENFDKYDAFCFCEGFEDINFYNYLCKRTNDSINIYVDCCYGKSNLMQNIPYFENNNSKKKILFFIFDNDFNNKNKIETTLSAYHDDIFVLDCYSVENLFLLDESIKNIFLNHTNLNKKDDNFLKLISEFKSYKEAIEPEYKKLNEWFYILREIRKDEKNDFCRIKKTDLIVSCPAFEIKKISKSTFLDRFQVEDFTTSELSKARNFYRKKDIFYYGRGHNCIWLLESYLDYIYCNQKSHNLKMVSNISSSIFDSCLNDCFIPDELTSFLKYKLL